MQDRSHRPHKLSTTLIEEQEAIVAEVRRLTLIPLDDLLVVVREFVNPAVSRSGLDRCLRRHGVGSLRHLQAGARKAEPLLRRMRWLCCWQVPPCRFRSS